MASQSGPSVDAQHIKYIRVSDLLRKIVSDLDEFLGSETSEQPEELPPPPCFIRNDIKEAICCLQDVGLRPAAGRLRQESRELICSITDEWCAALATEENTDEDQLRAFFGPFPAVSETTSSTVDRRIVIGGAAGHLKTFVESLLATIAEFGSANEDPSQDPAKPSLTAPDGEVLKPKGGQKWSPKYRKNLEQKARIALRHAPKATREVIAKRLGISVGSVSTLTAWTTRNSTNKAPAPSGAGKNQKKVGLAMADEENSSQHHRHVDQPEQENLDEQLDERIADAKLLAELGAEQLADAKQDQIPLK